MLMGQGSLPSSAATSACDAGGPGAVKLRLCFNGRFEQVRVMNILPWWRHL
jgi:hypothetical protein